MKVSTKSRYSVRLMFDLALHNEHAPVLLKDVAERQQISEKYLSKLIMPLKNSGLVYSERGAYGGYKLAKEPRAITIREIYEIAEGKIVLIDCIQRENVCQMEKACPTRSVWQELSATIRSFLEGITLQDLIEMHNKSSTDGFMYNI